MHLALRKLRGFFQSEFHLIGLARRQLDLVLQLRFRQLGCQVLGFQLPLEMLVSSSVLLQKALELLLQTAAVVAQNPVSESLGIHIAVLGLLFVLAQRSHVVLALLVHLRTHFLNRLLELGRQLAPMQETTTMRLPGVLDQMKDKAPYRFWSSSSAIRRLSV